jgi:hypothetical protein
MRILAVAVLCLLISGPADAATRPAATPAKPASAEGLRGSLGVVAKPAPISLIKPGVAGPGRIASLAPLDPFDHADCRRNCSHTYFFCLQTDGAAQCPQDWTRCTAACSRPARPLPSLAE